MFKRRTVYRGAGVKRRRIVGVTGVVDWIVKRVVGHVVVECAGGSTFNDGAGDANCAERHATVDTFAIIGAYRAGGVAVRSSVRYSSAADRSRLRRCVGCHVVAQSEFTSRC